MLPCLYIHYTRLLCYFKETRVKLPHSQSLQLIVFRNINPQGVQEKKHKSLKPPSSQILEDKFINGIIKNKDSCFWEYFLLLNIFILSIPSTYPTFYINHSSIYIYSIYLSINWSIYLFVYFVHIFTNFHSSIRSIYFKDTECILKLYLDNWKIHFLTNFLFYNFLINLKSLAL